MNKLEAMLKLLADLQEERKHALKTAAAALNLSSRALKNIEMLDRHIDGLRLALEKEGYVVK